MAEEAKVEEIDAGPFAEKGPRKDFCIQVEGKDLFVSKAILSEMSPVFEKLCCDDNFTEAQEAKVELRDQKYKEIVTMLKCMVPHPSVEPVTEENLEVLMRLGALYFVRFLQDSCNVFLKLRLKEMEYTDKTSLSYLKMASMYNTEKVFDDLIALLILQVSNLEKEFLSENDADLQPEIACRLYRHCYLKYKNSSGIDLTKEYNKSRLCMYCRCYQFTVCACSDPLVCVKCDSDLLYCKRVCAKCGEPCCLCKT